MKRFDTWLDRWLDRLFPESGNYRVSPVSTETPTDQLQSIERWQSIFRGYFVNVFRGLREDRDRMALIEQRLAAIEERSRMRTSVDSISERN